MYTIIERFIFRGNTSIQGARCVHDSILHSRHMSNPHSQHLGLPFAICRSRQDIPHEPALCHWTLQHSHLDHATHRQPVRCYPDTKHELHWPFVWLRSRISVGLWIYQVPRTAREDFAIHRRKTKSPGSHTTLCVGGPKDVRKIRRSSLDGISKNCTHTLNAQWCRSHNLHCRHTKAGPLG